MMRYLILVQIVILSIIPGFLQAQEDSYSLEECINYAWEHSTDVSRANNGVQIQNANLEKSKADRDPNLLLSGSQTFNAGSSYQTSGTLGTWESNNTSNFSLSLTTEVTLYNGAKLKNAIAQSKTNVEAAETEIQTQKELISLNVLSAYIDALLALENVQTYEAQLSSTEKQLELAQAREEAGLISRSDFLNIKSQYATDKASLIDAKNNLRINLVALMQLMNMPLNESFNIQEPNIESLLSTSPELDADVIYTTALGLQPIIKTAELNLESVEMDIKIAKADALPQLSLGGGLGTGYTTAMDNINWGEQISNKVSPYVGLSLSVPIYQRKKVKTNVAIAKLQTQNEELAIMDLKNDLRKYIEQACIDAQTAQSNYVALQEQYDAVSELYQVSEEMFTQGLINSVDFLSAKNNLLGAENKLTQAKYNVILEHKIIDYYMGNTILF